jgi:SIT4-associating protein SAP185/190
MYRATRRDESIGQRGADRVRYAFVACEILSSEVWSICETIFENLHLLQKFWTFIDAPPPLNPLRASYFTKVNEKFLEKKTEEMIPFIQSIPHVLTKILRHSDTSAIMDLLLKIISMERTDVGSGIVEVKTPSFVTVQN